LSVIYVALKIFRVIFLILSNFSPKNYPKINNPEMSAKIIFIIEFARSQVCAQYILLADDTEPGFDSRNRFYGSVSDGKFF
jgi:hypothetical protein